MERQPVYKEKTLDSTLSLIKSPYLFITNRLERYNAEAFETRILLKKTICWKGEEAARIFYGSTKFTRQGATPKRVLKTLFGQGGVQGTVQGNHRQRKSLFLKLLEPERISGLLDIFENNWLNYLEKWQQAESIVLLDELHEILTISVCEWAGVPLSQTEVSPLTEYLSSLIDSSGAIGPRHWKGRFARKKTDRWMMQVIGDIRAKKLTVEKDSPVYAIAHADDPQLASPKIAAVELINILRPTVAVARFINFTILALHQHPEYRLQLHQEKYRQWFAQEVRRFFPFFPFVAALVKEDFVWKNYTFTAGARVLLDLYGTNHDRRIWQDPEKFYPERFQHWNGSPYNFIPQGGGDALENHRCPGETLAIELIKRALCLATEHMTYTVLQENLELDFSRVPAEPRSSLRLAEIRRKIPAGAVQQ